MKPSMASLFSRWELIWRATKCRWKNFQKSSKPSGTSNRKFCGKLIKTFPERFLPTWWLASGFHKATHLVTQKLFFLLLTVRLFTVVVVVWQVMLISNAFRWTFWCPRSFVQRHSDPRDSVLQRTTKNRSEVEERWIRIGIAVRWFEQRNLLDRNQSTDFRSKLQDESHCSFSSIQRQSNLANERSNVLDRTHDKKCRSKAFEILFRQSLLVQILVTWRCFVLLGNIRNHFPILGADHQAVHSTLSRERA